MDDLQTPETVTETPAESVNPTAAEPTYRYALGERVTFGEVGTLATIVGTWTMYGAAGYRMRTDDGVEVDVPDSDITGRAE